MKLLLLTVSSDGCYLFNHFDLIDQYFNSPSPYLLFRSNMIFNRNKTVLLRTVIDMCVCVCVRACLCACLCVHVYECPYHHEYHCKVCTCTCVHAVVHECAYEFA